MILLFTVQSSEEGAQTSLHCALSDECGEVSGEYYADCKRAKTSAAAKDDQFARRLWDASERITGVSFPK